MLWVFKKHWHDLNLNFVFRNVVLCILRTSTDLTEDYLPQCMKQWNLLKNMHNST